MDETTRELRRLIEGGADTQGAPVSRLGYFCAPFRPPDGPFRDSVIKVYRSGATAEQVRQLAAAHADYLAALRACGVTVPETNLHIVGSGGVPVPVIVQEALPAESMMRVQMLEADRDGALALMEAAGEVIATFWAAAATRPERIGFHPSIRNLAVIDGRGIFFDTFPPLIGFSREEMGQLLVTYSWSRVMRMLSPLLSARIAGIQDEWYSPPETLVGLVGSACRLRPDDIPVFLDWGRDFARRRMAPHAETAIADMRAPPQLPSYWVTFRRLLGLQGADNVQ